MPEILKIAVLFVGIIIGAFACILIFYLFIFKIFIVFDKNQTDNKANK